MVDQYLQREEFLDKLVDLVYANLGDEKFGAKELAQAVGISHRKLSSKLQTIKKTSVCRFICEIRLQRAMELLQEEDVTAAEVAFKVGFASPTYFNKCFHEFFGFPPGKIKKEGLFIPREINAVKVPSYIFPGRSFLQKVGYALAGLFVLTLLFITVNHFSSGKSSDKDSSKGSLKSYGSIAVLPFINDSQDKENEYFCNGLTTEILNQLQKISALNVKSRASVEKYRNTNKDIKVIGHELGVSFIIEGSVRKVGDDLRISAVLIDAKTGTQVWSETYDGKYTTQIFEFQSTLAKKVAESLNVLIIPNEGKRIDAKPTKDLLAHNLVMKGNEMCMKWWDALDNEYLRIASNFFDEALQIDPNYLDAKAGKGGTYLLLNKYDSALIYFEGVLKVDRENRDVLEGVGSLYMNTNKSDSAIKYFQKLVDLYPNYSWANLYLATVFLFDQNEVIKGFPVLQKAYDLGGISNQLIMMDIGHAYFYIGEYNKALKYIESTISQDKLWCGMVQDYYNILYIQQNYNGALNFLDSIQNFTPCSSSCDLMRFYFYTSKRDFKKADIYFKKLLDIDFVQPNWKKNYYSVIFNYFLRETGRNDEALKRLNSAIKYFEADILKMHGVELAKDRLQLAASYAMLGENKKALEYLSQLEKYGLFEYPITLSFPGFDNLRNDPEFKAIVKRIEDKRAADLEKIREMEQRGELNL